MSTVFPFHVAITDLRLARYVAEVWDYLPRTDCERLAKRVSAVTSDCTDGDGVCLRWTKNGPAHIQLSSALARNTSAEWARHIVAHELAHAYYDTTGDYDTDEANANGLAARWGFPRPELLETHWTR